jgi:hypothetical protein
MGQQHIPPVVGTGFSGLYSFSFEPHPNWSRLYASPLMIESQAHCILEALKVMKERSILTLNVKPACKTRSLKLQKHKAKRA